MTVSVCAVAVRIVAKRSNEWSCLLPRDAVLARYVYLTVFAVAYAVVVSVCLSQAGTVPKRLNVGSRRTIGQGL